LLGKPTLNARATKETAPDIVTGQAKPSFQRFLLNVDGQTKRSFTTRDAAEKAGLQIKQAYPIVQVSIYDSAEGSQIIIGAKKGAAVKSA
jgi:hypothetical protein